MIFIQVDSKAFKVDILVQGCFHVFYKLDNGIQEGSFRIVIIGCIGMGKQGVFVHVANEGINQTGGRVQVATWFTSFRLHIATTNTTAVLFADHLSVDL